MNVAVTTQLARVRLTAARTSRVRVAMRVPLESAIDEFMFSPRCGRALEVTPGAVRRAGPGLIDNRLPVIDLLNDCKTRGSRASNAFCAYLMHGRNTRGSCTLVWHRAP